MPVNTRKKKAKVPSHFRDNSKAKCDKVSGQNRQDGNGVSSSEHRMASGRIPAKIGNKTAAKVGNADRESTEKECATPGDLGQPEVTSDEGVDANCENDTFGQSKD